MNWSDIAFEPDPETVNEAFQAWDWLVGEPWRVLVSSMFGGLFFEKQSGGVFWLECGTGLVERVADDAEAFDRFLGGERNSRWYELVDEWFLPSFVQQLHDAGLKPGLSNAMG